MTNETEMPDVMYLVDNWDLEYTAVSAFKEQRCAEVTQSIYHHDRVVQKLKDENDYLKNTLRDILKAVIKPDNGVNDTIWVDQSPIGDVIMCALDEDIDLDELQNSPYRCKHTGDMFVQELQARLNKAKDALKGLVATEEMIESLHKKLGNPYYNKSLDEARETLEELG